MADFWGYEKTKKDREILGSYEERFGGDAHITRTQPDWPNFESGPATKAEKPGPDAGVLAHVKYYVPKGKGAAQELTSRFSATDFKAKFGAMFDKLDQDEDLNLRHRLWRDFVEQTFLKDPELVIPERFGFPNRPTAFWLKGFTREIKRVLGLALKEGNEI
ncbi:MAG: hypothetical protein ACLPVO_16475 [Desulfomonilaceae bacterium]